MRRPTLSGLRASLPAARGTRRLVAASLVDSLGTGLFLAGSALFFTRVLGLSAAEVGVGLSPGDRVVAARSSAERVGQVVLAARERAELEAALADVRRTLAVVTRPG